MERSFWDDLSDPKIEALEFDSNLELENYIDWVQAIERIIELKECNDEKAFKLAILKLERICLLVVWNLEEESG